MNDLLISYYIEHRELSEYAPGQKLKIWLCNWFYSVGRNGLPYTFCAQIDFFAFLGPLGFRQSQNGGGTIFKPRDHLLNCIIPRWLPKIYQVSYLCSQKSDLSDLKFDFGVMGHLEYVKMYHNFIGIKF